MLTAPLLAAGLSPPADAYVHPLALALLHTPACPHAAAVVHGAASEVELWRSLSPLNNFSVQLHIFSS